MAFRRRPRISRLATKKKALWVNIPFGSVSFTESVGNQALLIPEDWEAQFSGTGNETAVLRAIVGALMVQPTVAGTIGTTGFWGIYIAGANETAVPTFTVAGMSEVDWLLTGAFGTAGTLVSGSSSQPINTQHVFVRAKRRLKSRDSIYICAQYGADAASPAGVLGGILRFLVARD